MGTKFPPGVKRVSITSYNQHGGILAYSNSLPVSDNPAEMHYGATENAGSDNLKVDGSSTEVEFIFAPPAGKIVALYNIRILFVSNNIRMGDNRFGNEGALTNGMLVQLQSDGVLSDLYTIKRNTDFLRYASPDGVHFEVINGKDTMTAIRKFGGAVLLKDSASDFVKIKVRDNLTGSSHKALFCDVSCVEVEI